MIRGARAGFCGSPLIHTYIQWVPGALSSGVKRQQHEAEHSFPTSAEVKKMWIYSLIRLHGVVLN
jgi:hypothetical protein